MNPESYFENEPWAYVGEQVRQGALGTVKAVAVQAVCSPGKLASEAAEWQSRLDGIFGAPAARDEMAAGRALSILARYPGPVIARLFFDEGGGEPAANFEIVGTDGLLIWKPDSHPLSTITTAAGCELSVEQHYPNHLAKEAAQ